MYVYIVKIHEQISSTIKYIPLAPFSIIFQMCKGIIYNCTKNISVKWQVCHVLASSEEQC